MTPISGSGRLSDQCVTAPSYKLSTGDHALMFGSIVIKGYAGALSPFCVPCAKDDDRPATANPSKSKIPFIFLISICLLIDALILLSYNRPKQYGIHSINGCCPHKLLNV